MCNKELIYISSYLFYHIRSVIKSHLYQISCLLENLNYNQQLSTFFIIHAFE